MKTYTITLFDIWEGQTRYYMDYTTNEAIVFTDKRLAQETQANLNINPRFRSVKITEHKD